jgi:SNARE domain
MSFASALNGGHEHAARAGLVSRETDIAAASQRLADQLRQLEDICSTLEEVLVDQLPPTQMMVTLDSSSPHAPEGPLFFASESATRHDGALARLRQDGRALCDDTDRLLQEIARVVLRTRDHAKIGRLQQVEMEFEDVRRCFLRLYAQSAPNPALSLDRDVNFDPRNSDAARARAWGGSPSEPGRLTPLDEQQVALLEEADHTAVGADAPRAQQLQSVESADARIARERLVEFQRVQRQLTELQQVYEDVASIVQSQSPMLDSIEANIDDVDANVAGANKDLAKAHKSRAKSRAIVFPLVGALVGTVVGGPIGLVAGLKGGAIAGVATLGAVGGFGSGMGLHKLAPKS